MSNVVLCHIISPKISFMAIETIHGVYLRPYTNGAIKRKKLAYKFKWRVRMLDGSPPYHGSSVVTQPMSLSFQRRTVGDLELRENVEQKTGQHWGFAESRWDTIWGPY